MTRAGQQFSLSHLSKSSRFPWCLMHRTEVTFTPKCLPISSISKSEQLISCFLKINSNKLELKANGVLVGVVDVGLFWGKCGES